jgi:hypothetical protein
MGYYLGLTEAEFMQRERLLELQKSKKRWFSQEEFDRLNELSKKMIENSASPFESNVHDSHADRERD